MTRQNQEALGEEVILAEQHDAAGRHDEAINVLARATGQGDVEAMTRLGKRLVLGDRAPFLPHDGARFLIDAANKGGAEATARLAVMSATGAYVTQNWKEALEILIVAAERGWAAARGQLCVLATDRELAAEACADEKPDRDIWRRLGADIDLSTWTSSPPGETLNVEPLIRSFTGFATKEVCNWIIGLSSGRLERARVYDSLEGKESVSNTRTNTTAVFNLMETDLVHLLIQARMEAACGVPVANMEAAAVLHYAVGEEIDDHYDFVDPKSPNYEQEIAQNGQRVITFLVYLNGDYTGGETDFPRLDISHKGESGEGLFFVNALPSGEPDLRTAHAGRALLKGEKWILSQFIRNRPVLRVAAA